MPLIPKIPWRTGKKNRYSLPPQPTQTPNLGSLPLSNSTLNTSSGTGSYGSNSQISLPSDHDNRVHRHVILSTHFEHPDDIQAPAELDGIRAQQQWSPPVPRFSPPTPLALRPPPPEYEHLHHTHQPVRRRPITQDVVAHIEEHEPRTYEKDIAIARQNDLERERNASAENVRRLRELIRQKYALDLYVWQKRDTAKANRRRILLKCEEADRIYQEILWIVNAWDEDLFDDAEEWRLVKKIKAGLLSKQLDNGESNEPAYWDNLKPWEREDDSPQY